MILEARVWSELNAGPEGAGRGTRYWHYRARRGNVSIRGLALSWAEAMRAVRDHLEAR